MREFLGKTAVVTGAASGIGRAIAERCVALGVNVVAADIEEAALEKTGADLKAMGGTVLCIKTDVSKWSEVETLARRAFDDFGGVHLLFNNAGVAAGGAAWEATWNDWDWVINVDLWGVIHGVKVFTPLMMAQNTECHIVNTASAAGLTAGGFSAPYSVVKHAVVALSESLYLTLRQRNSLVNASVLCPGIIRTSIASCERNRPEELRNEAAPWSEQRKAGHAMLEALLDKSTPPSRVAEMVFEAIENEQFYVLTNPEWMELIRLRTDKLAQLENPVDAGPTLAKILNIGAPAAR
ncbi:MAG TPA: SDR family NAD(P)-dependent oxidoreductase [Terracidiphilus sp.]|jgi:NAD(P)-dependent dehydrogenase (short-subunit alcohol dehydrogenase family)